MLRQTSQKVNGNLLPVSIADAAALPYPSDQFDTAFSTSVFHFIREPQKAIQEMYRVLKPNGQLILTVSCRRYRSIRMLDLLLKYIDPAHYRCHNLDECIKMLNEAGFSIDRDDCYKNSTIWGMMTIVGVKRQT
jgi:ubiquinone/menaquinone biosynthesis C-methylase UbiE